MKAGTSASQATIRHATSKVDENMPEGILVTLQSFERQIYGLMKPNWNYLDYWYVWHLKGQKNMAGTGNLDLVSFPKMPGHFKEYNAFR